MVGISSSRPAHGTCISPEGLEEGNSNFINISGKYFRIIFCEFWCSRHIHIHIHPMLYALKILAVSYVVYYERLRLLNWSTMNIRIECISIWTAWNCAFAHVKTKSFDNHHSSDYRTISFINRIPLTPTKQSSSSNNNNQPRLAHLKFDGCWFTIQQSFAGLCWTWIALSHRRASNFRHFFFG